MILLPECFLMHDCWSEFAHLNLYFKSGQITQLLLFARHNSQLIKYRTIKNTTLHYQLLIKTNRFYFFMTNTETFKTTIFEICKKILDMILKNEKGHSFEKFRFCLNWNELFQKGFFLLENYLHNFIYIFKYPPILINSAKEGWCRVLFWTISQMSHVS